MQLMPAKITAARISGILHPKYQVHRYSVDLTAHKVFSVDPTGQVDFGGGEYVPAGRVELTPQHMRLEDSYLWWDLSRGCYFVQCNEILDLAEDEIALLEPEDRLLRAGAWHVPFFVRGHLAPIELLLHVNVARLRLKENARLAHVRLFRITDAENSGRNPRKTKARRPSRVRRMK